VHLWRRILSGRDRSRTAIAQFNCYLCKWLGGVWQTLPALRRSLMQLRLTETASHSRSAFLAAISNSPCDVGGDCGKDKREVMRDCVAQSAASRRPIVVKASAANANHQIRRSETSPMVSCFMRNQKIGSNRPLHCPAVGASEQMLALNAISDTFRRPGLAFWPETRSTKAASRACTLRCASISQHYDQPSAGAGLHLPRYIPDWDNLGCPGYRRTTQSPPASVETTFQDDTARLRLRLRRARPA